MTGTNAWARPLVAAAAACALLAGCTASPTPQPSPSATAPTAGPLVGTDEPGYSVSRADPQYPAYGNPDLDVLSYQLALAWAPTTKTLTGTATLAIRPTVDVTELSLDFAAGYTVDGATVDGVAATAGRRGNDIVVPAGHTLARGHRTMLVVRYHGTPKQVPFPSNRSDAGEGLGLRATADGEAWTMQEPYGSATWYPSNDHPSDEALYDITVTVPAGWTAVASGTPGDVSAAGGEVTYRYRSTDPVASYLTTLAIGRYTKVTDTGPHGLPVTYWLRTGRDEPYLPVVKRTPELLTYLESRYGPYPFPTAGVVIVDGESAMETQQLVTYGGQIRGGVSAAAADPIDAQEVLLHELSHQWFGDAVTPTDWDGLWLSEGWAMYIEWMWTIDTGVATDKEWMAFAPDEDSLSRVAAGPPGKQRPGHFGETTVYFGGALLLREIRKAVGDTEFFALARDWVQTQRNQPVDRDRFIAFVNRHTGRDFTQLINLWLDSPHTPPTT